MTAQTDIKRRNCLNFIRLFAAAQVMIKHLVVHLSAPINGLGYTALSFFDVPVGCLDKLEKDVLNVFSYVACFC